MSRRIGSFPTHFLLNNTDTTAFSASALVDAPILSSTAPDYRAATFATFEFPLIRTGDAPPTIGL